MNEALNVGQTTATPGSAAAAVQVASVVQVSRSRWPHWLGDGFTVSLVSGFFLLNLYMVLNHAMWRDEWGTWQFGRFLPSLADVIQEGRYGGHPAGWYVLGWLVCQVGFYPTGLKLVHVLIMTSCVYVFTRHAPFPRLCKALFVFGYFPFYEYGTIMRDYALEMLLLMIACLVFTSPRRRPVLFGLTLALLFQTNAFGVVLGLSLGLAFLCDLWWQRDIPKYRSSATGLLLGGALAGVGVALAYLATQLPADALDPRLLGVDTPLSSRLYFNLTGITRAYSPLPGKQSWVLHPLDFVPHVQVGLSIVLFVAAASLLAERATALLFFVVATSGTLLLLAWLNGSNLRHEGHLFLALVLAAWICQARREPPAGWLCRWPPVVWWQQQRIAFLLALFGIHLVGSILASLKEQRMPFSGSREAAAIIRAKVPANVPIVADMDYAAAPVSGYLDRPIYIACRREYRTFCKGDNKRRFTPMPLQELFACLKDVMATANSDVVLLLNYQIQIPTDQGQIQLLGLVDRSIAPGEVYMILLCVQQHQSSGATFRRHSQGSSALRFRMELRSPAFDCAALLHNNGCIQEP